MLATSIGKRGQQLKQPGANQPTIQAKVSLVIDDLPRSRGDEEISTTGSSISSNLL